MGELYLEFHRGTYTAQARTKRGNRRSEHLLHEAELWAATAAVRAGADYPYEELEAAWRRCCCSSSTTSSPGHRSDGCTTRRSRTTRASPRRCEAIIAASIAALTGAPGPGEVLAATRRPCAVDGVPAYGIARRRTREPVRVDRARRRLHDRQRRAARHPRPQRPHHVARRSSPTGREAVPPGQRLGLLQLFRDTPSSGTPGTSTSTTAGPATTSCDADEVSVIDVAGGGSALRTIRSVGSSTITQTISLDPGSNASTIETHVDWRERQRMLKLAIPGRRAHRPRRIRDPVRAHRAADAHEHELGRGAVRDTRAPMGARHGGSGSESAWRTTDVWARHHPPRANRRRDLLPRAADPAEGTPVPRSRGRPGRAHVPHRDRRRRHRRGHPAWLPPEPPAPRRLPASRRAGRSARTRAIARTSSSRRSSSPRTAPVMSSSASTRPGARGARPRSASASPSPMCG